MWFSRQNNRENNNMQYLRICSPLNLLIFINLLAIPVYADESPVKSPENIVGTTLVNAEDVINTAEKQPDLMLIDSRISGDRLQGYIEGSISLPDKKTDCNSLSKILKSTTTPVLFYCNGPKCGRSANAVKIALSCNYQHIYWFRGGFEEWKNKNYPYIKD